MELVLTVVRNHFSSSFQRSNTRLTEIIRATHRRITLDLPQMPSLDISSVAGMVGVMHLIFPNPVLKHFHIEKERFLNLRNEKNIT